MKISLVTPLYRSAPYIEELHTRAVAAFAAAGYDAYEVVFVDDCGPDDSLAIARAVADRDPNVKVVELSRNFGQHRALLCGMAEASGDLVFIMDSDLEELPEWIIEFEAKRQDSGADVIFGVQAAKKKGPFYRFSRRLFYTTLNWLSDLEFPRDVVTARLMSRRYVDALLQFGEREVFLAGLWHVTGFAQVPMRVEKVAGSETTYRFSQVAALFMNAITAFSTRPLMAIGVFGIGFFGAALTFIASIIFRKLVWGIDIEGWASVMAVLLTIGGLVMLFNGIMALYIAKIFLEVKNRPRAIVKDRYPSVPETPRSNATKAKARTHA